MFLDFLIVVIELFWVRMDIRRKSVPISPLRSPTLQRHLRDDIDIHYPDQFLGHHSKSYKQLLIGKDGYFRAAIDVKDFEPKEVQVKTVGHTIFVSASHDEKEDEYGHIERRFSRKYVLPLDMDIQNIESWISKGVLYIKVPPTISVNEHRIIDIKLVEDKE